MFNERILVDSSKNIPKQIMMIPPTMLRLSITSFAALDSILLIKTPNMENTIEKPKTKNTVLNTMFNLLMDRTVPFLDPISVTVVPDMYARKAGIIGKIQGAINELRPATNATKIVGSAMLSNYYFSFKDFFHIFSKCSTMNF